MGFGKDIEQDGAKFVFTVLGIVALIIFLQNSGGVAQIGQTLFGGLNNTVGTLLDRKSV